MKGIDELMIFTVYEAGRRVREDEIRRRLDTDYIEYKIGGDYLLNLGDIIVNRSGLEIWADDDEGLALLKDEFDRNFGWELRETGGSDDGN